MHLMTTSNTISTSDTMTSLELRDIINSARAELGESKVRNDQLLARIEDELAGDLGVCKIFAHPQSGAEMRYYDLTRDQCTLVGMRESKAVRRSVLAKLKAMGSATPEQSPAVKDPQLAAMVMMLTQLDTVKQEQDAQRNELAEIKAKIQATPDQFYTVAGYASLRGMSIDTKKAAMLGRKAAKLSREYDMDIGKAHSSIHGTVNTYHVDILCEVFE